MINFLFESVRVQNSPALVAPLKLQQLHLLTSQETNAMQPMLFFFSTKNLAIFLIAVLSIGAQSQWQRPTTPNYEGQSHTLVCISFAATS